MSADVVLAATSIHPDRQRALADAYGSRGALSRIAAGSVKVSPRARQVAGSGATALSQQLTAMGLEAVDRSHRRYPRSLLSLADPPLALFVRGEIPDMPAVAIVGTRRSTRYGRTLAHAMGEAVAGAGWVTVSGLARGIDIAAHRGTLAASGAGIAVLGSGPDVWYPPEHRNDGEALAATGAVITEYPPGTPPEPWRFPVRNRIIAGLSGALVVVEAGETGGALITARLAMEQGLTVFAVPGDIDRPSSIGTNLLIRDGAHPVLGPDDLIAELSLVLGKPPSEPVRGGGPPLLQALGVTGATADELCLTFERPVSEVLADLARLEASGTVRREGDRYLWTRAAGATHA